MFLIQPSPDPTESLQILHERGQGNIAGIAVNRFFTLHSSNYDLASNIVYTEGKTPEECAAKIITHYRQCL